MPVNFAAPEITVPKTYRVCENYNASHAPLQQELSTSFGFKRLTVDWGQSAFTSVPEEVPDILIQVAEGTK